MYYDQFINLGKFKTGNTDLIDGENKNITPLKGNVKARELRHIRYTL